MRKVYLAVLSAICLAGMSSVVCATPVRPSRPPQHRPDVVYVRAGGHTYHRYHNCERLRARHTHERRVIRITRDEARRKGYRRCNSCF